MNKNLLEFREINLILKSEKEVKGHYNCGFCGKQVQEDHFLEFNKILSKDACYCSFCLRMGWNTKNNRNCLIISFRPIIAYFYAYNYLCEPKKMWLSNIKSIIQKHVKIGRPYPFLSYDEDSMYWFIDFRKIGRNKINVNEVEKALMKIATSLNLQKNLFKFKQEKLKQRISFVIKNFYENRASADNLILIDSLDCGCGDSSNRDSLEILRSFSLEELDIATKML